MVRSKQKRRRLSTPPPCFPAWEPILARRQVVRHVVERRVQLVADALHRANGGNSDKSGNQAVLNRGRTLFVTDQLQKLAHGLRSLVPSADGVAAPRPALHLQDVWNLPLDLLKKCY